MPTLNQNLKEFDEKFNFLYCMENVENDIKSFLSQSIKTALESVEIKEGDYTWKRTEQEPTDDETTFWEGYNTCREIVKKNIENYLKN